MKRGLVTLDLQETSREVYAARLDALRAHLQESGSDMALIYGDVSRSGDINYLTNLCLYWNEAILAVPRQGEPALITKLSKRVQPWMKTTSILGDIRSGPRLGESIGKVLDERIGSREGKITAVDLQWWPSGLVAEVRKALPKSEIQEAAGAVREQRLIPAPEELKLLRTAAGLMNVSLESAWQKGKNAEGRTSVMVGELRRAGFMDALVTCRTLSDGTETIDAIGQYRYVWVHTSRPRGGAMAAAANGALKNAIAGMRPGVTETQLAEIARSRVGPGSDYAFSCLPHPDIETKGLFRGAQDRQRALREGEVVSVALSLAAGNDVVPAAETLRITATGAEAL